MECFQLKQSFHWLNAQTSNDRLGTHPKAGVQLVSFVYLGKKVVVNCQLVR